MNLNSTLIVTIFFAASIMTLIQMHLIFTRLANKYPPLYEKLGKPSLLSGNPLKSSSAGFVLLRLLFTNDAYIPDDGYLRKLHIGLRVAFSVEIIAWFGLILSISTAQ